MKGVSYSTGIQNFEKLRTKGAIYVDKTQYIRQLLETGSIYFLGRPRRFGKSLFLSTLHAFFEGKRDLFKGLAVDSWDDWDWGEYPVIHFDLNAKDYTYKESLKEKIDAQLHDYEEIYNVSPGDSGLEGRFLNLIKKAYADTDREVVVLIDEYDKPILDTMHDDSIKDMHRDTLRAFYFAIKSADKYLKLCFLTGITKFGQLNIFSGLNNLKDISLWNQYAGICGITEEELHEYYGESVRRWADEWGCTPEKIYCRLKENYDGYHFSPALLDIYNPWSLLNALEAKIIRSYWNATGGNTSFLYRLLQTGRFDLTDFDNTVCYIDELEGEGADTDDILPVLYQSGYLTIRSYDHNSGEVKLKYPNLEVEKGFLEGLLPAYSGTTQRQSAVAVKDFVRDVEAGDVDGFMERMQVFFEEFPYENSIRSERQFQNIMYCITRMMGLEVNLERHSARGSADMVIETDNYIYIFEFKVDKSPEAALRQIEERGYALPFAKDKRAVFKVGVEFSLEHRNILRWKIAD